MNHGELTAVLGAGTQFEGRLIFEGVVRIDGQFKGEVFTRDTLVIGEQSKVFADIDADIVIIAGYLEGSVRATSRVEIQSTGCVSGKVAAPVIRIEEGGTFEGTTQMLSAST